MENVKRKDGKENKKMEENDRENPRRGKVLGRKKRSWRAASPVGKQSIRMGLSLAGTWCNTTGMDAGGEITETRGTR